MADETKQENNLFVLTMPAEIAFCNLFDKRAVRGGNREQWDMTVLLPADSTDLAHIKKLCVAMFKQRYPDADLSDPRSWGRPWEGGDAYIARMKRDKGEKAPDNGFMEGKVLLKSHSMLYPPNLSVNMPNRGIVDFRDEGRLTVKDKFYPGCLVYAEYNFQAYKGVGQNPNGVTAYLNKVCSLNKGERRGGGRSGAEVFGAYVGKLSATDPTTDVDY